MEVQTPRFQYNRQMKGVRLSALCTCQIYSSRNIVLISVSGLVDPRFISVENTHDIIGNRKRDLPASSVVPQPTASPRAPRRYVCNYNVLHYVLVFKDLFKKRHNVSTRIGHNNSRDKFSRIQDPHMHIHP
jgi:hypothetical protein